MEFWTHRITNRLCLLAVAGIAAFLVYLFSDRQKEPVEPINEISSKRSDD